MNSRSCRWLIVSALLITASGAWAQCNPVFGAQNIATLKQQAVHGRVPHPTFFWLGGRG